MSDEKVEGVVEELGDLGNSEYEEAVGVSTEKLSAIVLPWAKKAHPEKYEQTLKVSTKADTFRRYLLRLLEIRCAEEAGFIRRLPVSLLDETALSVWVRDRQTGELFEVKGRGAPLPHLNRFWELALAKSDYEALRIAKVSLDLEHVDGE